MRQFRIFCWLYLLFGCFCLVAGITAEKKPLYYPDLFIGFETENELNEAKKQAGNSKDVQIKEGVYYFITASNLPKGDKKARPLLEKAVEIFDQLWRQNRSDDQNTIRLAYAYTALCNTNIPLDDVMAYVFKARNLFSMVVIRSPQNMDARLGRTHININLTPQTGRPDDVILEDAKVFLAGYNTLTLQEQERPDLKMGAMVMRLANVVVWDYKGNKALAKKNFDEIDPKHFLTDNLKTMYQKLAKKYRR